MKKSSKRSTIYFDPDIHQALKVKAATTDQSVSEIVNEAMRVALNEDQADLKAFTDRVSEPTLSYSQLLDDLKANGKI